MTTTAMTPSSNVQRAVEALRNGSGNIKDLLRDVAQPEDYEPEQVAPPSLSMTDEQRAALDRVAEVFGSVVPDEVRELTPAEIGLLLDERITLDTVKKMAAARIDVIRDTVLNHSDMVGEGEDAPIAKNGHKARTARVSSGSGDKEFSVETRSGSVSIDVKALKALSEDPEVDFSHEDYLACTTQTRVFDEHKAMLLLKERPEAVEAISRATNEASPSVAVYVRKRK